MKKTPRVAAAGLAVAAAVLGGPVAGCSGKAKSPAATPRSAAPAPGTTGPATTSAPARPTDYAKLLITAGEINAPEAFTAGPPIQNPDGRDGAQVTFTTQDGGHVIVDTILIFPDPAAARAALDAAKATLPGARTGKPAPLPVGTGGTSVSGDAPDRSKGVTMLRFTEGRALVTLEFDGPPGVPAPPDFITDVGRKQDAAIKKGLPT
ncbi:MAG: hypothetical protein QJR12_17525 [Mycobacterium sp.]|uniref:hypothetical protein n=1 Tax=Mycobacterium sp. TaxID=1785 RepID=UPI00262229EB|nr:hypothetical protein [Mycobacterium sp.]MDI3315994.1 hypothetical protein [Mycobacterium sp.]